MAKKKTPKPSALSVWKGIRKDPVPPARVIQPKDRDLEAEDLDGQIEQYKDWRGEDLEEFDE